MIIKKRKTISLAVKSAGELYVKAPFAYSEKKTLEFLDSRKRWIEKRLNFIEQGDRAGVGLGLTSGRILFYLGIPRILEISGTEFIVYSDRITVPEKFSTEDLESWYRQESHRLVSEFIKENKDAIPECTFNIRKQKRIWGSCNSKRRININSRISMCRPSAVEYVLWHEICHLKHMDHSKRFYRHLEKVCPGYVKEKKWLKENEVMLMI